MVVAHITVIFPKNFEVPSNVLFALVSNKASFLHLGEVVENKPASSLVVSLGKALNGTPHLYVEDRWPINLEKGNSHASANFPSKV